MQRSYPRWLPALAALMVLAACGGKKARLEAYPEDPALWAAVTGFYDYLQFKQLDGYYDQPGIRQWFPDREPYYDFLDTVLPPMRERRFERNRIIGYTVHEIKPAEAGAVVRVTFRSDDTLPFGKVMTVEQSWRVGPNGWVPGRVEAPKAGLWDKLR